MVKYFLHVFSSSDCFLFVFVNLHNLSASAEVLSNL